MSCCCDSSGAGVQNVQIQFPTNEVIVVGVGEQFTGFQADEDVTAILAPPPADPAATPMRVRISMMAKSSDGLGTVQVRFGGTDGGVDGATVLQRVVPDVAYPATPFSYLAPAVIIPFTGPQRIKVTATPSGLGQTVTLKQVRVTLDRF